MAKLPSLRDMLNNGVHFGHVASRWNPKMKPFIYAERDHIHVINLEQTRDQLTKAITFLNTIVADGGKVLFVGTKRQAKGLIQKAAKDCSMPYMTERWFGGTLTNFSVLQKNISLLQTMEDQEAKGELDHLTKKERLGLADKKNKLSLLLAGVREMPRLPQALFVVDSVHEHIAVAEAKALGIPTVAIVDTNANPTKVDYPIPANDDAVKSLELILSTISHAIVDPSGVYQTLQEQSAKDAVAPEAPATPADEPKKAAKSA